MAFCEKKTHKGDLLHPNIQEFQKPRILMSVGWLKHHFKNLYNDTQQGSIKPECSEHLNTSLLGEPLAKIQ